MGDSRPNSEERKKIMQGLAPESSIASTVSLGSKVKLQRTVYDKTSLDELIKQYFKYN
jgi:hypothetical protein